MPDLRYELIDDGGNVTEIDAGNIVAGDITREHTALGTHTVDVKPAPDSLNDLCFNEARLYYGNDLLFRGYLLKVGRSLKTADATLEGEGIGRDLKKGAAAVVYANGPYYRAIADYWERFTDFDAAVITPSLDTIEDDTNVFDTSNGDTIQDSVTIEETDPLYIDLAGDDLVLAQSCFTREGESLDRESGAAVGPYSPGDFGNVSAGNWSGTQFVALTGDPEWIEYDFNLDYSIAAEDLGLKIRDRFREDNDGDYLRGNLIFSIDGTEVLNATVEAGNSNADIDPFGEVSLDWRDRIDSGIDLASGSHTLRIEAQSNRDTSAINTYLVDVVAPYDTRFAYNFDNNTDANDALAGPELYPDAFSTELAEIATARNIDEGRVESSLDDTTGAQRWGLRNNPNELYIYNDNTEDATVYFGADTYGTTLGSEIRLSRYDTGSTTTPTEGDAGQRLQDYTLFVTTNDLAVIQGQKAFEGSHLENLQQLHEDSGMRFTIEYEPDSKPVTSYKPGDVTRTKDWTTLDSDTGRDVYDYWNHVVAVGRRRPEGRLKVQKPEPDENGDITSDEITRVSEVVTRKRVFSEIVDDEAELEREAASLLAEGVSGDKFDGSIDIMAADVAPGYRYESLDAFDGRDVDLESVDYGIAAGDASGSLTFGGAQKTTETSSQLVEAKRDETDTRRSIGEGLTGQLVDISDSTPAVVGTNGGEVLELTARAGALQSSYDAAGAVNASVERGGSDPRATYVNSGATTADSVVALGGADEIWMAQGTGYGDTPAPAPAIGDARVFVAGDGGVRSFNRYDETQNWERTDISVSGSPAIFNRIVVADDRDGTIYTLTPSDGATGFSFSPTSSGIESSPIIVDGDVIVAALDGNLYATNPLTDTDVVWSTSVGTSPRGSPSFGDDKIYFAGDDGTLYAIDYSDGSEIWSYSIADDTHSTPIYSDGVVYLPDSDGVVHAVDAANGTEDWTADVSSAGFETCAAVGTQMLVVGDTGGIIYGIRLQDEAVSWQYDTGSQIYAPVYIDGGENFATRPGRYDDPVGGI